MDYIVSHFLEQVNEDEYSACDVPDKRGNSCLECLEKGVNGEDGWSEFACRNKSYLYIAKFFPAAYEESVELLSQLKYLPIDCTKMRVLTIGQGPGADVLALMHHLSYFQEHHVTLVTMDKTPAWLCEYDLIVEGIDYGDPFGYDSDTERCFDRRFFSGWAHLDKYAVNPMTELDDDLQGMFPVLDYGFDVTFVGHFFSNLSPSDTARFSVNIREYVAQRYVLLRGKNTHQFYENLNMFLKIVGGRILYHSDSMDPLRHDFSDQQREQVRPDLFKSSVRMVIVCDQPS